MASGQSFELAGRLGVPEIAEHLREVVVRNRQRGRVATPLLNGLFQQSGTAGGPIDGQPLLSNFPVTDTHADEPVGVPGQVSLVLGREPCLESGPGLIEPLGRSGVVATVDGFDRATVEVEAATSISDRRLLFAPLRSGSQQWLGLIANLRCLRQITAEMICLESIRTSDSPIPVELSLSSGIPLPVRRAVAPRR